MHVRKSIHIWAYGIIVAAGCSQLALAQTDVVVPGSADLKLAGQANGTQVSSCASAAPLNSPPLVGIPLTAGQGLRFTPMGVIGGAGQSPGIPPEGTTQNVELSGFNGRYPGSGIANILAPEFSLIGMFLGPQIDPNADPPNADYSGGAKDFEVLHPLLQQPFFIANGKTPQGRTRVVVVPSGATRLYLGTNQRCAAPSTGSFVTNVEFVPVPSLPGNPITVSAVADLKLAGQANGTQVSSCASAAPLNWPPLVDIPLTAGQALRFTSIGLVAGTAQSPGIPPEGTTQNVELSGFNGRYPGSGIANILAPEFSLIGMFLGPQIDPNANVPDADFSSSTTRDMQTISPLLQQPFYIGKGYAQPDQLRRIIVPTGASRLYLGTNHRCAAPNTGSFFVTVVPDMRDIPDFTAASIVNSAGFQSGHVSAGSIVSLFGEGLSSLTNSASAVPLPRSLAGSVVWVDRTLAPLFFVSPLQLNMQVPFEINQEVVQVVAVKDGVPGIPVNIQLVPFAPGIFTADDGSGIVINNSTGRLVTSNEPARPGDFLIIYASGLGPVAPPVQTGVASPSAPLSQLAAPVSVKFGSTSVAGTFAGLAPGFVGLFQVNVEFPTGLSAGLVPLSLVVVGFESNVVQINVQN